MAKIVQRRYAHPESILFFGLVLVALLATAGSALAATADFTVVLIPDTQFYTTQDPVNNRYSAQTQWIKDNATTNNIQFAMHMGDIVQDRNVEDGEWQIANAAHAILESGPNPVPYSVMQGNHDLLSSGSPDYTRDGTKFNEYFGPQRFASRPWYGGHMGTGNENNYSLFSVGNLDFMVLCLEPLPTDAALAWANGVVQAHPDRRVILATHVFLNSNGSRAKERLYENIQGNNANDIFDKLVKNNGNIFMTLCGHRTYEALNTATNAAGKPVYEVLSDYQNAPNGGDGWLRTLRFEPSQNRITLGSYSPTLDQYNRNGSFSLAYDMGSVPPDPATPAALAAYWDFDHGVKDLAGTCDLTLRAGATLGSGRFGQGLHVTESSTDGFASTGPNPVLNRSAKFSVAMWASYATMGDSYGRLLARMEDANNGYNIAMADGTSASSALIVRVLADGTPYYVTTSTTIQRGTFHHVAFSFDDAAGSSATEKIRVWIDGVFIPTTDTSTAGSVQGTADLVLGKGTSTSADFAGTLDEVRFYQGVLTQAQVAALQHAPTPGDANGDNVVDQEDAAILAAHWLEQSGVGWNEGDFNADGRVNDLDASILAAHWQYAAVGQTTVPEPRAEICLLAGILGRFLGWRLNCRRAERRILASS